MTRLALSVPSPVTWRAAGEDVDVLSIFDGSATSKRYFGVQFYLEVLLGCPVGRVTIKALRPELRPSIEQDRVNV